MAPPAAMTPAITAIAAAPAAIISVRRAGAAAARSASAAPAAATNPQSAAVLDPDVHRPARLMAMISAVTGAARPQRLSRKASTAEGPASAAQMPKALASSSVPEARRSAAQNDVLRNLEVEDALIDADQAGQRRGDPEADE